MTLEQEFEFLVLRRIGIAERTTGHSFARLLTLVDQLGAVEAARRLIAPGNIGRFQRGMRVLYHADLLSCSVERAVIDFGKAGKIFSNAEIQSAEARLQVMAVLFAKTRSR